ncbi:hypothetical protein B0H14DRAFT_361149 [Mycena olivaceomarginata]|nr:hypothetical protein B0H14DRAFT_361149 [Mycena olivaceomarginata]
MRYKFLSTARGIESGFSHVINLAVKAGLKEVTELPDYELDIVLDDFNIPVPHSLKDNLEYWDALKLDPIAAARKLVTACRASGQRRDTFKDTIEQGNAASGFGILPRFFEWRRSRFTRRGSKYPLHCIYPHRWRRTEFPKSFWTQISLGFRTVSTKEFCAKAPSVHIERRRSL